MTLNGENFQGFYPIPKKLWGAIYGTERPLEFQYSTNTDAIYQAVTYTATDLSSSCPETYGGKDHAIKENKCVWRGAQLKYR